MPFINTKTNITISKEQEMKIKSDLGKAIEILPGKSENWLMVSFEENNHLYFKGNADKSLAFVEVKLFGKSTSEAYDKLTAEITKILHRELQIVPDCIYVKYEEASHWGYNGHNF